MGASLRYLSQRYSMPTAELKGLLTDIGTEELGHLEMVGTIVHQLTRNLTEKQIEENPGFASYFIDHTTGVYPTAASGFPWSAASIQSTGDPIADLNENLAAEQKARITYDNILRLVDDPDVIEPIKFLRQREIVHYQRFGDTLPQSCKLFLWSKVCALLHIFTYMFQMMSILSLVAYIFLITAFASSRFLSNGSSSNLSKSQMIFSFAEYLFSLKC